MAFEFPWFKFWVKDFLTDSAVASMDYKSRGAYVTLLCHQWLEGTLPEDTKELARLLRIGDEEFSSIWTQIERCFKKHVQCAEEKITIPDRILNARLDGERALTMSQSEQNKEYGRKGGKASAKRRLKIAHET